MTTEHEYQARRVNLARTLAPNSIAFIGGASEKLRNGDACYRFRQDSDFYYLTGFNEPDAVLAIIADGAKSILFSRPNNPQQEQWTGKRLGQDGAIDVLKMDEAYPIEQFNNHLPELLAHQTNIYSSIGKNPSLDTQLMQGMAHLKSQLRKGATIPEKFCDLQPALSELRLFKSDLEIQLMRHAAQISVKAHQRAMKACPKLRHEYELVAELMHEMAYHDCLDMAYDPIVAGGARACILHYTDNNQPLNPHELVLIDAGAEYKNYAADITRTFPAQGVFSFEQKQIYELVLAAQTAALKVAKPGVPWNEMQQAIIRVLVQGLRDLKIIEGNEEELLQKEAYRPFYMHQSGHWLGLDVHDAGCYKNEHKWRNLEANMVLTVEPGLYIPENMPGVDSRWWGIGVRIEDDILITPNGHECLSAGLPVNVQDIEALMRG